MGRAQPAPGAGCRPQGRHALRITTQHLNDGVVQLALDGELDLSTVDHLHSAVARTIEDQHARRVLLDLAAVEFCDSTGIRALVTSYDQARDAGLDLRVINPQDMVLRVLHVVGVWDTLTAE